MNIVDAAQRQAAIDPLRSFCVSAPAGSGKTELLIQRYLALLARVERPEQVLAITFTRKAAAEMRERVVQALQAAVDEEPCDSPHQQVTRQLALAALTADERGSWRLLRDISRLNIKTIDSFCNSLTRQMPVLSQFGGQAALLDDASELYAEAVLALFQQVDSQHAIADDLAALMLHFDNNWEKLQTLLMAMLARRDQWRDYVGAGTQFAQDEAEDFLLHSVAQVVEEELAALAQALAPYSSQLLDLLQFAQGNLGEPVSLHFPGDDPVEVRQWRRLCEMLLTKDGGWRKALDKRMGFPADKGEPKERKAQLKELIGELSEIEGLLDKLANVMYLPELETGSKSWQLLLHLSHVLPMLAAQLLLVFQRHGAVDHSQVAMSALQALGEDEHPTELALRLDYRIEHILVDEFQDTAISQYDLLCRLTRGWGAHNEINPQGARTVLIVGDGMQSIYGFRSANVGLFLKAREEGFNGVRLEHLELRSNFRSDEGVVNWVNETFVDAFPPCNDINRGQVTYSEASPVRPEGVEPAVTMHAFHGDEARLQEVAFIADAIAAACADDACEQIAVLGRSRSHLQPIISELKQRKIPYSAQNLDSLASSPVVADLLNLCRALANAADRLAWMALLRAPWCALQLDDLLVIGRWGEHPMDAPVWPTLCDARLHAALSAKGRERLEHIVPLLQRTLAQRDRLGLRVWVEQLWQDLGGPQTAAEVSALEDAEIFLQLLEQADAEGVGFDVDWLLRRLESRFMNGGDPMGKVQLMTLHKAKGLEFDRVIIPQLARASRSDGRLLLLWDEHNGPGGERHFLLAADDHSDPGEPTLYNYLKQQRQQKTRLEGTRLLYVGVTRAVSQLLLTATLAWDEKKQLFKAPGAGTLLSPIWTTFEQQMIVHEPAIAALSSEQEEMAAGGLLRLIHPVGGPSGRESSAERPPTGVAPSSEHLVGWPSGRESPAERPPTGVAPSSEHPVGGPSGRDAPGLNVPTRPTNHVERSIGTVVHLALEELSLRDALPDCASDADHARWRMALQQHGLSGAALDEAQQAVRHSVDNALAQDSEGRWLLSSAHPQARSEWALSSVDAQGLPVDMIIDRSFIDAQSGVRWLVDYKNSQPEPDEALVDFFRRQSEHYREQLLGYRNALRGMGPQALRCALYFPALGQLHPVDALDLPALE